MPFRAILSRTVPGSKRASTLIEIMVATSILTLLSVVFALLFAQVRTSAQGGGARIEIRGIHRQAQQRLTLVLRSAIPPNELDPAIAFPPPGGEDEECRFYAPVNILEPHLPFEPRTPDYPLFRVRLPSSPGPILVGRVDGSGAEQRIGRGFKTLTFHRADESTVAIRLMSEMTVRGAAGSEKVIEETSESLVRVPSIR